ncbi:hypothetical protein Q4Q34_04620 [Flavivirga abyssicola]|uniref:hypothetical protein n=1 Tax=Flavivirga abyssicola TaxID=3063533 RepID=UPI0026DF4A5C|nr:hypothetical protein [Flavivirga sp. MEBiC07777]WVK14312.1 hypothetical protein Q4Q34_04620 [Flavivirga sp. MEBiC07777]
MKKTVIILGLIITHLGFSQAITDTGDEVGIGTTTPTSKLHVAGNGAVIKLQNTNYEDTENAFYGWLGGYDKSGDEIWYLGEGSANNKSLGFFTNRNGYDLKLWNNKKGITIKNSGYVGIGTTSPSAKLQIDMPISSSSYFLKLADKMKFRSDGVLEWGASSNQGILSWDTGRAIIGSKGGHDLSLYANSSEKMRINQNGDVGIGTTDTKGFKLGVQGKIAATEVKVAAYSNWADFVFEKNYKLPTLKEVEEHIKENGHLKDIPSAKEVIKDGFFLGDMDSKLLQKIEELTLYTIEQQKELQNQKVINEALEERLKKIEKLLYSKKQ